MSIIAISGKIGSGKDAVAGMIQKLTSQEFNWKTNTPSVDSTWKVRKFAGKLKQMASLLTGFSVEDLEKPEVKNSALGPEWERKIIWTAGLEKDYRIGYVNHNTGLFKAKIEPMTVRQLLQELGTDAVRNQVHQNAWVNALFADYKSFPKGKAHDLKDFSELYRHKACINCAKSYNGFKRQHLCKDCIENPEVVFYPNWLISDMRFPNELEGVKARGGFTVRVNRPKEREMFLMNAHITIDTRKVEHESETALDNANFDYTIENNGTLDDLLVKVQEMLVHFKIIT